MKKINILLAILWCPLLMSGQVSINLQKQSYLVFSHSDVFNFTVVNSNNQSLKGRIQIRIESVNLEPITYLESNIFELSPGINSNWQMLQSESIFNFFDNPISNHFNQTGNLITGHYELCIAFIPLSGEINSVSRCFDIEVLNTLGLKLIFPCDGCELPSPNPLLKWNPQFIFDNEYTYTLQVCKIEPGQSDLESQIYNIPIISVTDLRENYLFYDPKFPPLENTYEYSWRVSVIKNNFQILQSEIWTFHLSPPNIIHTNSNLRTITPERNLHEYIFENSIGFVYNNRFNMQEVEYTIKDLSRNSKIIYQDFITLHPYQNQIEIPFSKIVSINKQSLYLLTFFDTRRQPFYLYFKLKE